MGHIKSYFFSCLTYKYFYFYVIYNLHIMHIKIQKHIYGNKRNLYNVILYNYIFFE